MTRAQMLRKMLDQVISDDVRPLLRERGFTGTRRVFRRQRGPMYDEIDIYGDKWNGINDFHTFAVFVGAGSTEIDELSARPVHSPPIGYEYLLHRPWCQLGPEVPSKIYFDETYDVDAWSAVLCDGLERVVDVIDEFDSSRSLALWAVANNGLHECEKTCGYLAAVGDIDTLVGYVQTLKVEFGHDVRWEFFSRDISAAVGSAAALLEEQGLLAPSVQALGTNTLPVDLDR